MPNNQKRKEGPEQQVPVPLVSSRLPETFRNLLSNVKNVGFSLGWFIGRVKVGFFFTCSESFDSVNAVRFA